MWSAVPNVGAFSRIPCGSGRPFDARYARALLIFLTIACPSVGQEPSLLSFGDQTEGAISAANEVDVFLISGTAQDVLTIALTEPAPRVDGVLCFEFRDPTGEILGGKPLGLGFEGAARALVGTNRSVAHRFASSWAAWIAPQYVGTQESPMSCDWRS